MNSGKANKATVRLVLWSLAGLVALFASAWIGFHVSGFILAHPVVLLVPWVIFIFLALYTSRDPDPVEPLDLNAIVAPAHGKVDVIEDTMESDFMQGACKRISIRVSPWDVQLQYAPVTGTIARLERQPSSKMNGKRLAENLFAGFEVIGRANTRAALRVSAGVWGRRIAPWIKVNDVVSRSGRIGMTRLGSRVDLFLPNHVKLHVHPGDNVAGGQSVVGKFE